MHGLAFLPVQLCQNGQLSVCYKMEPTKCFLIAQPHMESIIESRPIFSLELLLVWQSIFQVHLVLEDSEKTSHCCYVLLCLGMWFFYSEDKTKSQMQWDKANYFNQFYNKTSFYSIPKIISERVKTSLVKWQKLVSSRTQCFHTGQSLLTVSLRPVVFDSPSIKWLQNQLWCLAGTSQWGRLNTEQVLTEAEESLSSVIFRTSLDKTLINVFSLQSCPCLMRSGMAFKDLF